MSQHFRLMKTILEHDLIVALTDMSNQNNRTIRSRVIGTLVKKLVEQDIMTKISAIYSPIQSGSGLIEPDQTGTAFRVLYGGRKYLITAAHCLVGHDGSEKPEKKAVFTGAGFSELGKTSGAIWCVAKNYDLAAIFMDEFQNQCAFNFPHVLYRVGKVGTVAGYLARDFRRYTSSGTTAPQPFIYTGGLTVSSTEIKISYPRHKGKAAETGYKVMLPIPKGLSGGPIIDTDALIGGVNLPLGIFTGMDNQWANLVSEPINRVRPLLNNLASKL
jgi:hypothetical protein